MNSQISLFEILEEKVYVIHYFDGRGILHTEDLKCRRSEVINEVGKWRERNKDKYFYFLEVK